MGQRVEVVAVVGGGASGVLTAIHLQRESPVPVRVVIFEPRGELGQGIAYGTTNLSHLLNVRAGCMSALPDEPDHFTAWARRHTASADDRSFLPRAWYADYLRSLLQPVEHCPDRVDDIEAVGGRVQILLSGGTRRSFDRVVLAPGSTPPVWPDGLGGAAKTWIDDPWAPGALSRLPTDRPVLLVGTGLTAVDTALSLHAAGHRQVIATSRHGLLPCRQPDQPYPPLRLDPPMRPTARSLLTWARVNATGSGGWGPVVDALRTHTDDLWGALSESERIRILRHVQRRWEVVRHRMAPSVAASIETMREAGELKIVPGGVRSAQETCDGTDVVLADRSVRVGAIVNCTGPSPDVRRSVDPLVRRLLARRVVRPGVMGLGLDTDAGGCLPDTDGRLWLVGPLCRGERWETTAIPEIRDQAASLPRSLWRVDELIGA
ncbi:MAG: FAD/NAD(P)-binding protein [Acidimicrobiales bacterium]|jgi:uncharacterized NAD(P)/FAD-binding protein YdhS